MQIGDKIFYTIYGISYVPYNLVDDYETNLKKTTFWCSYYGAYPEGGDLPIFLYILQKYSLL
jgi:hypothetical protein